MDESNYKNYKKNSTNNTEAGGDTEEVHDQAVVGNNAEGVGDNHFQRSESGKTDVENLHDKSEVNCGTGECDNERPGESHLSVSKPTLENPPKIKTRPASPEVIVVDAQPASKKMRESVTVKLEPGLTENRTAFPSFRFMKIKKILGICAADHPHVCLTAYQLQSLASDLLEMVISPEGRSVRPRFYGMSMRNGYLKMICGDHTTAAWVLELPKKLTANGIRLRVEEGPSDNKTFIAVGHFPKSQFETDARILRFLEVQNEGLDCSEWRVMDRNYEKKAAVRLTFSIDFASAQLLKDKGPILNFKFAGARFMLKTKRGISFREEDCEDDDIDCFDNFPRKMENLEFRNPFAQTKPFASDSLPLHPGEGSQIPVTYLGGEDLEYAGRVAAMVEKSKTVLLNGYTSRERFLHGTKKGRKFFKKKKKKIKTEPN